MSDRVAVALIDDDEAILDSLQIYLRRRGFLVFAFRSAKAFLEEIGRAPEEFDCVVTDVRMPGTTGLQLQRSLADSAPELPLIIITGHGDIDMAVRAIKAGAYDFLENLDR
jgi:FixJ family two-component response regulator